MVVEHRRAARVGACFQHSRTRCCWRAFALHLVDSRLFCQKKTAPRKALKNTTIFDRIKNARAVLWIPDLSSNNWDLRKVHSEQRHD